MRGGLGPKPARSAAVLAAMGVKPQRSQKLRAAVAKRALAHARTAAANRAGGVCERCGLRPGDDPHHRRNRGMGGANNDLTVHALSRVVWICRPCHDWIGRNPGDAGAEGYLIKHNLLDLREVPLWYRGRWVVLDNDGGVTDWVPPINPQLASDIGETNEHN